ncbi:MAG: hypothetical protein OHK0015_01030 [Chloroflexi bacterium OHK40]
MPSHHARRPTGGVTATALTGQRLSSAAARGRARELGVPIAARFSATAWGCRNIRLTQRTGPPSPWGVAQWPWGSLDPGRAGSGFRAGRPSFGIKINCNVP